MAARRGERRGREEREREERERETDWLSLTDRCVVIGYF